MKTKRFLMAVAAFALLCSAGLLFGCGDGGADNTMLINGTVGVVGEGQLCQTARCFKLSANRWC